MDEINAATSTETAALQEARKLMSKAMMGNASTLPLAIEAMIDAKIAIAMEQLADRIQDASGVRP